MVFGSSLISFSVVLEIVLTPLLDVILGAIDVGLLAR
jgi:hypothetical protein